jgi:hypothetical protein
MFNTEMKRLLAFLGSLALALPAIASSNLVNFASCETGLLTDEAMASTNASLQTSPPSGFGGTGYVKLSASSSTARYQLGGYNNTTTNQQAAGNASFATGYFGATLEFTTFPTQQQQLFEAFTTGSSAKITAFVESNGGIKLTNTVGTTITTLASGTLAVSTVYQLGFVVGTSASAGTLQVWLSTWSGSAWSAPTEIYSSTSVDTNATNGGYCQWGDSVTSGTWVLDIKSLYIDTSQLDWNLTCIAIPPNGNGQDQNWSNTGGASAWQSCAQSGTSDYIHEGTTAERSNFTTESIATYGISTLTGVLGLKITSTGEYQTAASGYNLDLYSGGAYSDGTSTGTITTNYASYGQVYTTDPNTSSAWTQSGVNSADVGVVTGTIGTSGTVRVNNVWKVLAIQNYNPSSGSNHTLLTLGAGI